MKLCLHQGRGVISNLIKWQCRSKYSHASLLFSDGQVIESREFIGVHELRELTPRDGEVIDIYNVSTTRAQEHAMRTFAELQIGKPYDYISILRFMTREPIHDWQMNDWFCSELVFQTFDVASVRLLNNIHAWAVAPSHLALSTLAHYERRVCGKMP